MNNFQVHGKTTIKSLGKNYNFSQITTRKGLIKMEIKKHLKITGNSNISWKDAIVKAVEETSKTIDYLSDVTILEQRAKIQGDKIIEYFVDLDISFSVDLERKNNQ